MNGLSPQVLALLPEYILTVAGVLVMLIEAMLKPAASRKPLGWLAIAATVAAGIASYRQLPLGRLTAFSGTIQVDAFSVFPGKAFAATAERAPVRPRLAAMIQRLMRRSSFRAASRVRVV